MKVTFVLPGVGKLPGKKYPPTWKMEPLTIATLKALLPDGIETAFYDDRMELADFEAATDAVMMTVNAFSAKRACELSARYRARGVKVIMGGYIPTVATAEILEHCDCAVIGNAEGVMDRLVSDLQHGRLEKTYRGEPGFRKGLIPDRSVYRGKKYMPVTMVETGRGCVYNCGYCGTSACYRSRYYPRGTADVLADIESQGRRELFLCDENITADPVHAAGLFDGLKGLKVRWGGQASINMAKDAVLLGKMRDSGCEMAFVGLESIVPESLRQMNKEWNLAAGDTMELIKRAQGEGINIHGAFIFGWDSEPLSAIDATLEFALKSGLFCASFYYLIPYPGTAVYEKLGREGRLVYGRWWLEDNVNYADLLYRPLNVRAEELVEKCLWANGEFTRFSKLGGRAARAMAGRPSLLRLGWFLLYNHYNKVFVDTIYRLPIGGNLDGLPK